MKQEIYRLINENVKNNAVMHIRHVVCDGKTEIVIRNASGINARQRGLNRIWCKDIVKSGVGGQYQDDADNTHLWNKRKFGLPILCRDDPDVEEMWFTWKENNFGDEDKIFKFVELVVHTENFTVNQMAEYLTELQQFWTNKGAQLSDPEDYKLLKATQ